MNGEGSVKYTCERIVAPPAAFEGFEELNECRNRLHELGLIGVYPDGIGYGNISLREGRSPRFHISGAGTGHLPKLGLEHYARVLDFDFARNWVKCEGPVQASSESMTHAAVYLAAPEAAAVIHVHDLGLWQRLLDRVPTTSPTVEYGTPKMAAEIGRLFCESDVRERKIIAMAGHREGLVTFGARIEEAMERLLAVLRTDGAA